MAGQGITVSILAKIEGWLDLIKLIQNAMKNIKPGTDISKGLVKDLQLVNDMVNNLGKNMNQRLTSDSLITGFVDKIMLVEEVFNRLGTSMSHISFGDIKPEYITAGFKDLLLTLELANNTLGQGMESSFQNAIANSKTLLKEFERMKIDPKSMNINAIQEALAERGKALEKDVNEGLKKLTDFEKGLEKLKNTRDELAARDAFLGKDANATVQSLLVGHQLPTKGTILDADKLLELVSFFRSNLLKAGFTPTQLNRIIPDLETVMKAGHWDEMPSKFAEYLREAQNRTRNSLEKASQEYRDAIVLHQRMSGTLSHLSSLRFNNTLAQNEVSNILSGTVQNDTKSLRDIVSNLRLQLESAVTSGFKGLGSKLFSSSLQGMQDASAAMKDYSAALDLVKAKELAVSKVQGVVLRYFSIYAAVRMVSKGIRSMMTNIKDLDKTITEIAIVTKMDQNDLWGLMPQYTKLAKNYAASISGVYKVSQLYYQQGLGQQDVMALTELTLKMARISGLDYAEATDYMTNAVRSFKMEMTDAATVVDVYSAVAASSASSVTELATAMSKTASSAAAVGSSFENTTAMLAVMIEATRESPENIGSAMKSIISRYGELKENKTGIDEEGEAYSLNKVDKALLTVGISIHDTNGEFRDFDDVIFELAEKWNTIDKNTLRYIATVMAGNRQQSRFLALVSSTERLKEESAKAANSEDASQLQFLKTMDSIEAKTQLFLTTLLSLYTSSGLEKLYKGLLDFGNEFATTLENISGKNGLVGAISNVGASFVNMATLATTAFSAIKRHLMSTKLLMLNLAADLVALSELTTINTRLAALRKVSPYTVNEKYEMLPNPAYQKDEIDKLEARKQELEGESGARNTTLLNNKLLNKNINTKIGLGMAASAAGMALSTWASSIDINENRGLKGLLTAGSSGLSGLGTGLMVGATAGGPLGALVGALTALPGVIQGIGMLSESTTERVEKLEKNITEAKNDRIKSKDELKTLEDYKKKYDELSKSLYESAEKKKEFLELSNSIASSYPELIKSMDAEGNYIVNMTEGYERLAKAKREAYKTDLVEEMSATISGLEDLDYILKNIYNLKLITDEKVLGMFDNTAAESLLKMDYTKDEEGLYNNSQLRQGVYDKLTDKGLATGGWLETAKIVFTEESVRSAEGIAYDLDLHHGIYLGSASVGAELLTDVYMAFVDQITLPLEDGEIIPDLGTAIQNIKDSGLFDKSVNKIIEGFDSDFYTLLSMRYLIPAYLKLLVANRMDGYTSEYINLIADASDALFKTESTDLEKRFAKTQLLKEWSDKYDELMAKLEKGETIDWLKEISDFYKKYGELWYNILLLSEELKDIGSDAEDFYKNLGLHTEKDIDNLFPDISTEGLEGEAKEAAEKHNEIALKRREFFKQIYKDDYDDIIQRYNKWLEDEDITKFGVKDYSQLVGAEFLPLIQSLYKTLISNTGASEQQILKLVEALNAITDLITDENLDFDTRSTLLSKYSAADFTSLTGIYNFIETLSDANIDVDLIKNTAGASLRSLLLNFSNTLSTNLITSFEAFSDTLVSNSEDFDKALSKASSGMNLKEAAEMADKLNLRIKDFTFKEGKYYYDTLDAPGKIQDAYMQFNKDLKERLDDEYQNLTDKTKNDEGYAKGLLLKVFKFSTTDTLPLLDLMDSYSSLGEDWANLKDINDRINKLKDLGFDKFFDESEMVELINLYDLYHDAWELLKDKEDGIKSLNEYVLKELEASHSDMTTALDLYTEYELNTALLKNGYIAAAVTNMAAKWAEKNPEKAALTPELKTKLENAIATNNLESLLDDSVLYELIGPYISFINSNFDSVQSGIADAVLSSFDGGTSKIKVSSLNKNTIKKYASLFTKADGTAIGLDEELEDNSEVLIKSLEEISLDESTLFGLIKDRYINLKDRLEAFKTYHKNKYSKNVLNRVDTITASEVSADDFIDYLMTADKTITADSFLDADNTNFLVTKAAEYGMALAASGDFITTNWSLRITKLTSDLETILNDENALILDKNAARSALATAKLALKTTVLTTAKDILDNYNDVSIELLEALANALNKDLNSEEILQLFTEGVDGKTHLNTGKFLAYIKTLPEHIRENLHLDSFIQNIIDDDLKNITSAISLTSKGTSSRADIQSFKEKALLLKVSNLETAFSYDEVLNAWTLDPAVLYEYVQKQAQLLVDEGLLTQELVLDWIDINYIQTLAKDIDIKSFLESENRDGQARDKLAKLLKNIGIGVTAELQDDYIELIIQLLEKGGINSVAIMKAVADMKGEELSSSDIELAYRANIKELENAFDLLAYGPGGLISGRAKAILDSIDTAGEYHTTIEGTDTAIITKTFKDISAVYQSYYDELKETNTATLEALNEAYAKVLETKEDRNIELSAIDALGNAAGMTYTALGAILSEAGYSLEEIHTTLEEAGIIESMGGNKVRIKDFAAFARTMKWDFNSEEYTGALKTYNDSLIELNTKSLKNIIDEFNLLSGAKAGDWLNFTYLTTELQKYSKKKENESKKNLEKARKINEYSDDEYNKKLLEIAEESFFNRVQKSLVSAGAYFDDGILKISKDANLLLIGVKLSEKINELANDPDVDLDILTDILDAIVNIFQAYTDAISKGIKGSLTNVESLNLIQYGKDLGIDNLDFSETAEGLKLSLKSAIRLYHALSLADGIKSKLVFDELVASLEESNSQFADSTSLLTYMSSLISEINSLNGETDGAKLAQYEAELAVAKEIMAVRLNTDDKSWDFMSTDLVPSSIDNAIRYWLSWSTATKSLDDWAESGQIDYEKFASLAKHAIDLADREGRSLELMGKKVGGPDGMNFEQVLEMIADIYKIDPSTQKAFLSAEDMLNYGFDMKLGSVGLSEELRASARSFAALNLTLQGNIHDFYEKLNNFKTEVDKDKLSFDSFIKDGFFDVDAIKKQSNKAYDAFMEFTKKVKIGLDSLYDSIKKGNNKFAKDSKEYKIAESIFAMMNSDDWNVATGYLTIKEHLINTGFEGVLDLGDIAFEVRGRHILTKPDGSKEEWYAEDGTKYTSVEEAWNDMNKKDLALLEKDLGLYEHGIKDSEKTITVDGKLYTIEIKNGEVHVVLYDADGNQIGKEEVYSSTEAMTNARYDEYVASVAAENEQKKTSTKALSLTAWKLKNKYEQYAKEGKSISSYTAGDLITAETRAALLKDKLTTLDAIIDAWNEMLDTYGDNAAYEFEAKYGVHLEPGKIDIENVAQSLAELGSLRQEVVDIAEGITAALLTNEAKKAIGEALSTGLTESLQSQDTIEIEAPEIVIKPKSITIDTSNSKDININDLSTEAVEAESSRIAELNELRTEYWDLDRNRPKSGTPEEIWEYEDYYRTRKPELESQIKGLSAMSDEGYNEWIQSGLRESGTWATEAKNGKNLLGLITSDVRTKLSEGGWTSESLANEAERLWKKSGLSSSLAAAEFKIKTGIDIDPKTAEQEISSINWQDYIDQASMTLAAADVMSGITAAFTAPESALQISTTIGEGFRLAVVDLGGEDANKVKIPIEIDAELATTAIESIKPTEPVKIPFDGEIGDNIPPEVDPGEGTVNYTTGSVEKLPLLIGSGTVNYSVGNVEIPTDVVATGTINYKLGNVATPEGGDGGEAPKATGNVGLASGNARAGGTLMGELGPELVVSKGRYFVVGLSGPEMVNLADDAIVFNHLLTQSLLTKGTSSTRGRAITNELNAVAFATGSRNGGEAKVSLGKAVELTVIGNNDHGAWSGDHGAFESAKKTEEAMTGAAEEAKNFIDKLERWYNWLQKIALLEKEITIEEAKRTRYASDMVPHGKEYFTSQMNSLDALQEQLEVQKDLNTLREKYFATLRKELNQGAFSILYEFDENFLPKYKEGMYEFMRLLLEADWYKTGAPNNEAKTIYNKLAGMGFESMMQYDSSGNKINKEKEGWENQAVQAFVERYKKGLEEGLKYHDDILEGQLKVEELIDAKNLILREIEDNQITVENKVLKAIEDMRQREIDSAKDEKEAIEKSANILLDGLNEQLDRERNIYLNQLNIDELNSLQRRLGILQRSGGSASEIADLLSLIQEKQYDNYFEGLELQIQAILDASDAELERLDNLITLMEETLAYEQENGLLWALVNEILSTLTPLLIADFIATNTKEYWGKSLTELNQLIREDIFEIDRFKLFSNTYDGMQVLIDMYGEEAELKRNEKKKKEEEAAAAEAKESKLSSSGGSGGSGGYTGNPNQPNTPTPTPTKKSYSYSYVDAWGGQHYMSGFSSEEEALAAAKKSIADLLLSDRLSSTERDWLYAMQSDMLDTISIGSFDVKNTNTNTNTNNNKNNALANTGKTATLANGTKVPVVEKDLSNGEHHSVGDYFYDKGVLKTVNKQGKWETVKEKKKASGGYVKHGLYELGELGTETVFTASQTKVLRDNILSNRPESLINLLKSYNEAYRGLPQNAYDSISNTTSEIITIERAEVNLLIEKLADDYDSRRAANTIMDEMLRIASKTKANNSVRR